MFYMCTIFKTRWRDETEFVFGSVPVSGFDLSNKHTFQNIYTGSIARRVSRHTQFISLDSTEILHFIKS